MNALVIVIVVVVIVILGIILFFIWANGKTKKEHAHYDVTDVIMALEELFDPDARYHDTFDLFIIWPINDRYLESIRLKVLEIVKNDPGGKGKDISRHGMEEIELILNELRNHI